MIDVSSTKKPRSQFVTALAWFSIVVSALMVFVSIMQNVMVQFFFPPDFLNQLSNESAT